MGACLIANHLMVNLTWRAQTSRMVGAVVGAGAAAVSKADKEATKIGAGGVGPRGLAHGAGMPRGGYRKNIPP